MELLIPLQAATILGVKVETLTQWRCAGTGPAYHRIGGAHKGAIRYSMADLDAYIASARQAA